MPRDVVFSQSCFRELQAKKQKQENFKQQPKKQHNCFCIIYPLV